MFLETKLTLIADCPGTVTHPFAPSAPLHYSHAALDIQKIKKKPQAKGF